MKLLHNRLPSIRHAHVRGKRVLVRVDFNVPFKGNKIIDDFRIQKSLPTAEWLIKKGSHPVLMTHLDPLRPVAPVKKRFEKLLGARVEFLENLRFDKGEKQNSARFAKFLAAHGNIYVNDAFSVSHRAHASIAGISKLLPSYAGFLFLREVRILEETVHPPHPFLFIIAGLKFQTKVSVLRKFLKKANTVFIGGAIANTFLASRGVAVGKSVAEKEAFKTIQKHFLKNKKIILPLDVRVNRHFIRGVGEVKKTESIFDVGPKTLQVLAGYIKNARMVLWNGPLGNIEKGYIEGTEELIRLLSASRAKVIIGGGDTHTIIRRMKKERGFYHLSTGGGAMLEFLEDGKMPGIQALLAAQARQKKTEKNSAK